jgi:hypothetical protein
LEALRAEIVGRLNPKEHPHFVQDDRPEPALELRAKTQLVPTSELVEEGFLKDVICLARNPEMSFQEPSTCAKIRRQ